MTDVAEIDRLRARFADAIGRVATARDLQAVRDQFLGRKGGAVAALLKAVADAPAADRPALGRLANELKRELEGQIAERKAVLDSARPPAHAVDVTLPGRPLRVGRRHPITHLRARLEAIFGRMGYRIVEGPEIEDEYHNFDALQMLADHPARDAQDTLYLESPLPQGEALALSVVDRAAAAPSSAARMATLLRTHTSGMQIRYMETHAPPVRIVAPGRVYRRDNLDQTHTPMFQQVEGLVVDEGISMADLKGTLVTFLQELFGADTPVRLRPSFFPYTEPSAEVDVGCPFCEQRGCSVCKRSGWVEVLGSGMVHPAVLEAVGYDSERYTGFAFGVGLDRLAMRLYGVDDIRTFYENDLRFLEQFPA